MGRGAMRVLPAFAPASLLASNVGTWERDPDRGLLHFDETAAEMYGFTVEDGRDGIDPMRLRPIVHPDDHPILDAKITRTENKGGLMVFEYRTRPAPGVQRWVLVRGRYEPIRPGQRIAGGRGIVIDITESKLDGHVEDHAFFLGGADPPLLPLDRATDLALALHHEATVVDQEVPGLLQATRLALHLLRLSGESAQEE